MAKFLILNSPPPHPAKQANVSGCVDHFVDLDASGRGRVFPIVGSKGYATFVDVQNHDELSALVEGNPMSRIEKYQVIAIRDLRE